MLISYYKRKKLLRRVRVRRYLYLPFFLSLYLILLVLVICNFFRMISLLNAIHNAIGYILEDFKMHHHSFALFLQTVNAIEKLFAGFNMQPRVGMNQSLI